MVGKTLQTNLSSNLFSNVQSTKESSTVSSSKSSDFSTLMNQNLGSKYKDVNSNNKSDNASSVDKKTVASSSKKNNYKKDVKDYDYKDNSVSNKQASKVNNQDSTKSVSSDTMDKTSSDVDVTDKDTQTKVSQLEDDVKETIKEVLGLTDDQYANILSQLGIQTLDLLQPDNLKAFTLAANNQTDISSILTDENMANQLNTLLDKIGDINLEDDYGITNEQLQAILDNKNTEQVSDQKVTIDTNSKNVQNQDQTQTETEFDIVENPITIQVTKETKEVGDTTTSQTVNSVLPSSEENKVSEMGQNSQAKDDQGPKDSNVSTNPLDIFVNNLANGVNQSNSFVDQVSKLTQMREIVNQVVEQIKVNIKVDSTSMVLQLNPENLGKVNLTVTQKNGMMTAQFLVENEAVKEAIQGQMNQLRENLENQGLKVEAVEVTVSNFAFDQNSNTNSEGEEGKGTNKRKVSLDVLNMVEDDLQDETQDDVLLNDGGSINYIA